MNGLNVLVLSPDSEGRLALQARLMGLGCEVTTSAIGNTLPGDGEIIVLDVRADDPGVVALAGDLVRDNRPLIMVADAPCAVIRELSVRAGGAMFLTGAENDGGYKVALSLCAALAGRRRRPTPAKRGREVARNWTRVPKPAIAF